MLKYALWAEKMAYIAPRTDSAFYAALQSTRELLDGFSQGFTKDISASWKCKSGNLHKYFSIICTNTALMFAQIQFRMQSTRELLNGFSQGFTKDRFSAPLSPPLVPSIVMSMTNIWCIVDSNILLLWWAWPIFDSMWAQIISQNIILVEQLWISTFIQTQTYNQTFFNAP